MLPRAMLATIRNYRILSQQYGQYNSIQKWDCIDESGAPIPWYCYPAIEYIKQLDFSDKVVYEYGSGNLTLFWAARCKKIVSIEDNGDWYNKIKSKLPDNVEYHLCTKKEEYTRLINNYDYKFDVIVIDGSHRYECAVQAIGKLREDGFIILDNSDWHEKTSQLFRESDLIEVDMSGFGPLNGYTWTTSFYLKRNVRLAPLFSRQPTHGIGSLTYQET